MKNLVIRAVTLLLTFFLATAWASTVKELNWDDLKPVTEYNDPFAKLTQDQLYSLSIIAKVRQRRENGQEISESLNKELEDAEQFLAETEVDVERLFAKREEVWKMRRKIAEAVIPELNGKTVSMPGYMLPLEYKGLKVTEFLLVPWVGACIHTPPPPPNQIVYVKATEAFQSASRYEPVWIEGVMEVGATSKELFLVDGSSDIQIGYSMNSARIEKYQ